MDSDGNCFVCLENCKQLTSLKERVTEDKQIYDLLSLHFWFEFHNQSNTEFICSLCLDSIQKFHEFYAKVRDAHFKEENLVEFESYSLVIKNEYGTATPKTERQECDDDYPPNQIDDVRLTSLSDDDSIVIHRPSRKKSGVSRKGNRGKSNLTSSYSKKRNKVGRELLEKYHNKLIHRYVMNCELCNVPLDSFYDACDHYESEHDRKGYLVCCNRRYFNYVRIIEHLNYHDNPEEFKCSTCGKSYTDNRRLKEHLQIHIKYRFYKCSICEQSFTKKQTLLTHITNVHSEDKKFECFECKNKYATERSLKHHIRYIHEKKSARICHICAKVFKSLESYKLHHQIVHTNEIQKEQCTVCQKWFKHSRTLRKHVIHVHENPGPPQTCSHCGKISTNSKSLKAHIKLNHSNVSFPCTTCKKTFKRASAFKEHMAVHLGDKSLYTCTYCPQTFRSNANMYAHRKRAHPEELKNANLLGTKYNKNIVDSSHGLYKRAPVE